LTVCLVTGGAGFIGSHLIGKLLAKGYKVRVLDDFSTGKHSNLSPYLTNIELVRGDLNDFHTVHKAVKGVQIIFHLAALSSVQSSMLDPLRNNRVNITGTLQLLTAAKEEKVERFIFAGSSSVYGDLPEDGPKRETMRPSPISPYALAKYAGELYCTLFHKAFGMETLSFRYFNVYGPRQDPDSEYSAVIPKFIKLMLQDKSPVIYGDGTQSRDFVHVNDVAAANLLAAEAPCLRGEVVNIGSGRGADLNELVDRINRIMHKHIIPLYTEAKIGDIKHSLSDIRNAEKIIGYKPTVSFEQGLEQTIRWYENN